jgi:hypothetical protein
MPQSARIGRALLYRARSASTGAPTHGLSLFVSPKPVRRDLMGGAVLLPFSYFLSLGPVDFFGQVAGLSQTARVQRGPSEAARCASNGTALLPATDQVAFSFPSQSCGHLQGEVGMRYPALHASDERCFTVRVLRAQACSFASLFIHSPGVWQMVRA